MTFYFEPLTLNTQQSILKPVAPVCYLFWFMMLSPFRLTNKRPHMAIKLIYRYLNT